MFALLGVLYNIVAGFGLTIYASRYFIDNDVSQPAWFLWAMVMMLVVGSLCIHFEWKRSRLRNLPKMLGRFVLSLIVLTASTLAMVCLWIFGQTMFVLYATTLMHLLLSDVFWVCLIPVILLIIGVSRSDIPLHWQRHKIERKIQRDPTLARSSQLTPDDIIDLNLYY